MKKKPINAKELMADYKKNDDIFSTESEKVRLTKEALWNLSETDRLLIVLYCEIGSLRKLGDILGVSRTTAFAAVKSIKLKMQKYVAEHSTNSNSNRNNN